MARTSYPTVNDVIDLLGQNLLWEAGDTVDVATALEEAIEAWESDTGYTPFLASSTPTTRTFAVPDSPQKYSGFLGAARVLELRAGVREITSLSIEGVVMTEGKSYTLLPLDAFYENEPFTQVKLLCSLPSVSADKKPIAITACWGFGAEIPAKAWSAIRGKAAQLLLPQIAQMRRTKLENALQNGAQVEKARESGPIRVEFATLDASKIDNMNALHLLWSNEYSIAARRYSLMCS